MFSTFLKLCRWYQIAQPITYLFYILQYFRYNYVILLFKSLQVEGVFENPQIWAYVLYGWSESLGIFPEGFDPHKDFPKKEITTYYLYMCKTPFLEYTTLYYYCMQIKFLGELARQQELAAFFFMERYMTSRFHNSGNLKRPPREFVMHQ